MRILIIGGTNGTGRQVVVQALRRGHDVTLMGRNPTSVRLEHSSLRVLKGDVTDSASLRPGIEGQDAVIFAVGATLGALKTNPNIFSDGTRNTIDEMRERGVKRLVVLSSHGSGDSKPFAGFILTKIIKPLLLAPYYNDHERQEDLVRFSELDWVIVRPSMLTNGPAKGKFAIVAPAGAIPMRISRADVAGFLLKAAETNEYLGKAVSIGG